MPDFFCPDRESILKAVLKLLPRGRAWQDRDGGPRAGYGVGFHPGGYLESGFQTESKRYSVMWLFWSAYSYLVEFVHQRLCQLRQEFWCQTMSETEDWWLTEYGLPNACDPFPDLCVKVSALGGTRCEYYAFIAARRGWSITCVDEINDCGTLVGSRTSLAGRARGGHREGAKLRIYVDIGNSPAFTSTVRKPAMAGRSKAGQRFGCGPSLTPLKCILARVVHAEIQVIYEAV